MKFKSLVKLLVLAGLLAGCASGPEAQDPNNPATRVELQNQCVTIADRSERQACLDQAAFGQR